MPLWHIPRAPRCEAITCLMKPSSSPLSHWAWGRADRLPDDDARRALGARVGALLGWEPPPLRPPPTADTLDLPRTRAAVPAALSGSCTRDPDERARHTWGRGFPDIVRGFSGDFSAAPDLVARPRTEAEVAEILDAAGDADLAVVPFGGGSSVVGGTVCRGEEHRGVMSLDLTGLSRVLDVIPASGHALIQAGATGPVLEAGLAAHGLTLRHYPQSFQHSTLGGWIATRSGGHYATGRTHIDDFVAGVRMLTPAGPMETRRLPASGAGPDPARLILGSEGALGVITQAWMRVQPRPRYRSSASVAFADFASGVAAARAVAQSGLAPAGCRLLDAREAFLHEVLMDGRAVLLLGFEAADSDRAPWMDRALALCLAEGGELLDGPRHSEAHDGAGGRWRGAFFEAPYLPSALISLGFVVDTFETACPWDRFEALHAAVVRDLKSAMKRLCGGGLLSCRFTHVYPDGPAPYYTFLAPGGAPADQLAAWAELKAAASEAVVTAGGTITHHHAVGRTHRPGYDRERPDLFAAALRAVKATLDPRGVMNPGVLL